MVRDTGDPNKVQKLAIAATAGQTVEYSLWYGNTYVQGEVPAGTTKEIDFPHYTSFALTIARGDKIGWVFGRENDDMLAAVTLKGTASAHTSDGDAQALIEVAGLGGVKDSGVASQNHKLRMYATGSSVVEYSVWSGVTLTQGEIVP